MSKTNAQSAIALLVKLAGLTLGRNPATKRTLKNMSQPQVIVNKSTKALAKPPKPPQGVAATGIKPAGPKIMSAKPPTPVNPSVKPGGAVNPGKNVVS